MAELSIGVGCQWGWCGCVITVGSLGLVRFLHSRRFTTILCLSSEGMNDDAPRASGMMWTAIVGGALVPPLFGLVADGAGVKLPLVVPIIRYALIETFVLWAAKKD